MKVSDVFSGSSLKATDIGDAEVTVVIATIDVREYTDNGKTSKKLYLTFQGKTKGLVVNKTNATRLAKLYGDDTDGWIGKEIVLYVDNEVTFGADTVPGLRVRGPAKKAPPKSAPKDDMNDEVPF
jgi:hypothetical protein